MASPYATLKRRTSTGVAAGGAAKKVLDFRPLLVPFLGDLQTRSVTRQF